LGGKRRALCRCFFVDQAKEGSSCKDKIKVVDSVDVPIRVLSEIGCGEGVRIIYCRGNSFREVNPDLTPVGRYCFDLEEVCVNGQSLYGLPRLPKGDRGAKQWVMVVGSLGDARLIKASMYVLDPEAYREGKPKFRVVVDKGCASEISALAARNSVKEIIVGKILIEC